jgi:hypothetical protein
MRLAIDSTRHRGFRGRSPKSQAGGELALIQNDLRRGVDESGGPEGTILESLWRNLQPVWSIRSPFLVMGLCWRALWPLQAGRSDRVPS